MRELAAVVAAGMLVLGASCVGEMPEDGDDRSGHPEIEVDFPADVEIVYIYGQQYWTSYKPVDTVSLTPREATLYNIFDEEQAVLLPGHQSEANFPEDPCECVDQQDCLDGWAGENLGCNVCAVFVCGQQDTNPHVCHFCAL